MFLWRHKLIKGNFPFNLDNTLSIDYFRFEIDMATLEQCSSKFPDFVLTEITITIFNLTFRTSVFFELSNRFFFLLCIFQASRSKRWVSAIDETRDRVRTTFSSRSTPRTFLVRLALVSCSPEKHTKKKSIRSTRSLRERKSPPFLDQSERTSNLRQAGRLNILRLLPRLFAQFSFRRLEIKLRRLMLCSLLQI